MFQEKLHDRQRAFLLVSLLADRSRAQELIPFLAPPDQIPIRGALEEIKTKTKETKKQMILDELKYLATESSRTSLSEVHPDWIFEAMKGESPRMISTILRYLPGDQVEGILTRLPESILKGMPPLLETFSLAPELLQILKERFEENFFAHQASVTLGLSSFEMIPFLPVATLTQLLRQVGFKELAMAFATLNEQTINIIFRRLPERDATYLRRQMVMRESVSEEREKQAQGHLLSLDLEGGSAESLILESGFFIYSKAILPIHLEGLRAIQQKFSMPLGQLFKRYVDRNLPLNSEQTVMGYQREILEVLSSLGPKKPVDLL